MSRTAVVAYSICMPIGLLLLVFGPVGRIDWLPGWIFIGILVTAFGLSALVIAWTNPVIYRARSRFQPGTKSWDIVLLSIMLPAMVAMIPLATLDAGRMHWSAVPPVVVIIGYALLVASIAITAWAQGVNPFFEPGVRIQSERHQRVIDSGPYAIVRHPGYSAAIALFISMPLALASWWALLPAALASILLIVRARWEDDLLRAELSGYEAFTHRTRYRLVPGLW
jgi:protein-S-isoprenylcysteine O-methyltransferase Ste14